MVSLGLDGEVAQRVEQFVLYLRREEGGALVFGLDDHTADFVVVEGVEGEDVAQLYLIAGDLLLEVVYLVLEPVLVIVAPPLLLLQVLLQLLEAHLRSQEGLLVVLVLSLQPLDLGLLVLVVCAFLGVLLAVGVAVALVLILPLEELLLLQELVLRSSQPLPILDQHVLLYRALLQSHLRATPLSFRILGTYLIALLLALTLRLTSYF
jgi:hypothetical protein